MALSHDLLLESYGIEIISQESLTCPGLIQPYGGLLVLQTPDLRIRQVSQNIEDILLIPAPELLDKRLSEVLVPAQYQSIISHLDPVYAGLGTTFEITVEPDRAGMPDRPHLLRCQMHLIEDGIMLELEPQSTVSQSTTLDLYHQLQQVILGLRQSQNLLALAQQLVRTVAHLTGCDRVMVYQFMADDHGVVIAETKQPHLPSYLGLHYPAFDIPEPARRLFLRNWIRMIPDVNAVPVALVPALADSPLDLSATTLRGVSHHHIDYLQNMGVAATMTVSLIVDGRLWGLVACHHNSPKLVNYEVRKTCELLGQLASAELIQLQHRELTHYRNQAKTIQDALHRAFLSDLGQPNLVESVLTAHQDQLCNLVQAGGTAIVLDGQLMLMGQTPSPSEVQDLVEWLTQHHSEHLFATDALPAVYPPAHAFKDKASGLLAVSVRLIHAVAKAYHILWFRSEQIQGFNWAGNPGDAITTDDLGTLQLCPRKSFALWQEIVTERAVPWSPAELESAKQMQNTLMLAMLELSHMALAAETKLAASASLAKSQFVAKMSHELRTPLNVILGFTQVLLRDQSASAEIQDTLKTISRSGEHLLMLINDVLEMSRIEAGQITLNTCCFDLENLVFTLQDMFIFKTAEQGISFSVEWAEHLPRYVVSDEAKLRQILINLLSNAIKFTSQGRVVLRTTCDFTGSQFLTQATDSGMIPICFEVIDTGCGIPIHEQDNIFTAFHQGQTGQFCQGTGLGLTISRQFAQLLGGDITVESTASGSRFICTVMVQLPDAVPVIPQSPRQQVQSLAAGQPSYRILVVEDEPDACQMLKTLITTVGFEVMTAENGVKAVQYWRTWHPHLILMDVHLPILDGLAATQRIRQLAASSQAGAELSPPTPIIALTAYAFETDRDRCLHAGCDDYLAKPFDAAELFSKIAAFLEVRYDYLDPAPSLPLPVRSPLSLTPLPLVWRQALRESALALDEQAMAKLIAQIPTAEATLAQHLTALMNDFEFDEIARLADVSSHSSPS